MGEGGDVEPGGDLQDCDLQDAEDVDEDADDG